MKKWSILSPGRLIVITALLGYYSVTAQFYAPEPSFHDICQRHFVVEAARVQAWMERAQGGSVAEIAYELKSTGEAGNEWRLRWLDAGKKELRVSTVRYPHASLTNGPSFYRDVYRQLGGSGNKLAGAPITGEQIEKAFWEGAEHAGLSRMECLEAAFKLWDVKEGRMPGVEQAARLSGLLAQTPTHGFWQESALDGKLLARAAAWLCAVEHAGTTNDSLWSPIFFIAGRERAAAALWAGRTNTPIAAWWHVLIAGTPSDEALRFAASPRQRSRAMPMMAWHANISDGYMVAVGNLILPFYGSGTNSHRLYDYAPTFADSTVENGHMLNGAWAMHSRAAWVRTLASYPANPLDFQGYRDAVKKAVSATKESQDFLSRLIEWSGQDTSADPSTKHLDSFAPLLRLAYENSTGRLTPVAHVTARDLLHYGWENSVLQMQARHYFVRRKWGVPSLASDIFASATNNIPGFALLNSMAASPAKKEALNRLQYVNWTFGGHWPAAGLRTGDSLTNDASRLSVHWVRPNMARWLYNWWFWAHTPEERAPLLAALTEQGGRQMDFRLLEFLAGDSQSVEELRTSGARLTNGLPFATALLWEYRNRVRSAADSELVPTPRQCREAEALFWSNPNSKMAPRVFRLYLLAGEFPAAKTFYTAAMSLPYDAVSYSAQMSALRWTLAMLENDRKAMQEALEENETGSAAEFLLRINDAIYRQDYRQAEQVVAEGIERYGAGRPGSPTSLEVARRVLTLREALADPAHPGHAHAVGYLVNVTTLPVTQWLLINNLKMNTKDAVTFLGGGNAKGIRRMMICYLQKEAADFDKVLGDPDSELSASACAVAGWLRAELRGTKPTLDPATQRPKGAEPIEVQLQGV